MTLTAVVENETSVRLENAVDLRGDSKKGVFIPGSLVPFTILVLGLAVVWGGRDHKINRFIAESREDSQTVIDDEPPQGRADLRGVGRLAGRRRRMGGHDPSDRHPRPPAPIPAL